MNYSDYKVMLDIHEIGSQVYLTAKQGDTNRRICASLVESGKPYQISEDCIAVFTAKKPDGHIIFNNCTIADNVITYEITEQTVAAVGEMACELRLYGADNALLVCPRFTLNVVPAVFTDSEIVESVSEVTTLTSLIHEAERLVENVAAEIEALKVSVNSQMGDVNEEVEALTKSVTDEVAGVTNSVNKMLENGEFIPKLSIGTVNTLPAGSMATAEFTGTSAEPVLNLGIPQGPEGTNEELIPDAELSETSLRPVQNRVITAALATKANTVEVEERLYTKANTVEVEERLYTKVDKAEGKGLSSNDFTDEEKEKLAGIAESANKYSLPVGGSAIGGVKNGGDIAIDNSGNMTIGDGKVDTGAIANSAVTAAKIAANAVSKSLTVTLAVASWSSKKLTVTANGVTASNTVIVSPAPASFLAYAEAQVRCISQAANSLTFQCEAVPTAALTVNVIYINK